MSESKQCGCYINLENNPESRFPIVPTITYCPLHRAAPIGRELAEAVLNQQYMPDIIALARKFIGTAEPKERMTMNTLERQQEILPGRVEALEAEIVSLRAQRGRLLEACEQAIACLQGGCPITAGRVLLAAKEDK